MIKLTLLTLEFKTPLSQSKPLTITVQVISLHKNKLKVKKFPNFQKKTTRLFEYDSKKNIGIINDVLKCDDVNISGNEEPATIEINEEEGDDVRVPKKKIFVGKQLIKLSSQMLYQNMKQQMKQGYYQINIQSNYAKIKFTCEFSSSKNGSTMLNQQNKKKFISEDDDFTSDQNDILSINKNLGPLFHDKKSMIQVEKKNLNQIDDDYFFEESMLQASRKDNPSFKNNSYLSIDNSNNNQQYNSKQEQSQVQGKFHHPPSPIYSVDHYQYVLTQREQFNENSVTFLNNAKFLIGIIKQLNPKFIFKRQFIFQFLFKQSKYFLYFDNKIVYYLIFTIFYLQIIRFLRTIYNWQNNIQTVGFGIMFTLFISYFNIALILGFLFVCKFPQVLQDIFLYSDEKVNDDDLFYWNKFCQEFSSKIQDLKVIITSISFRETLFSMLVYLSIFVLMNSIFSFQKVFILVFWIHLFSNNYHGWKFCKVFHYQILGPAIQQAYSLIFSKLNLNYTYNVNDDIPDEDDILEDRKVSYKPMLSMHIAQPPIEEMHHDDFYQQRMLSQKSKI